MEKSKKRKYKIDQSVFWLNNPITIVGLASYCEATYIVPYYMGWVYQLDSVLIKTPNSMIVGERYLFINESDFKLTPNTVIKK